jgi:hypothetical protein
MENWKKPNADDWRRQGQEKLLSGVKLIYQKYKPFRKDWEHDHCEFCGIKFSLDQNDINEGYATEDGYHWVCEECYNDFKDEFNW